MISIACISCQYIHPGVWIVNKLLTYLLMEGLAILTHVACCEQTFSWLVHAVLTSHALQPARSLKRLLHFELVCLTVQRICTENILSCL